MIWGSSPFLATYTHALLETAYPPLCPCAGTHWGASTRRGDGAAAAGIVGTRLFHSPTRLSSKPFVTVAKEEDRCWCVLILVLFCAVLITGASFMEEPLVSKVTQSSAPLASPLDLHHQNVVPARGRAGHPLSHSLKHTSDLSAESPENTPFGSVVSWLLSSSSYLRGRARESQASHSSASQGAYGAKITSDVEVGRNTAITSVGKVGSGIAVCAKNTFLCSPVSFFMRVPEMLTNYRYKS